MPSQLIPPSKNLGYTKLYLDFVNGQGEDKSLLPAGSLETVANLLDNHKYDRDKLVDILTTQNEIYLSGPKTFENIKRLKEPDAVCLFAGQQAGLFGGPMYTIIKAIAIIKSAQKYEQELGRPVIPIFWIAGDDHDFEEANNTNLFNRSGEVCNVCYATPPDTEIPVARIKLSDTEMLTQVKEAVKECSGQTEFTNELYDLIDKAYTTDDNFVSAFGKLLAGLLGDRGLVLFCPTDNKVKQLAIPFFKQILDHQEKIHQLISDTNAVLTDSGYHLQVEKKQSASYMFYESEGRQPILFENDKYLVGEKSFTKDELVSLIEKTPEKFSPDVMTKPLFQSFLFPALAQKCGPSEVAYLTQINKLFSLFGLQAPVVQARPTATVVETRFEKLMDDLDISFDDLCGDIEQVINRVLAKTFPTDLEQDFNNLTAKVEKQFKEYIEESLQFDVSLKKVAEQTYGKIDYNLNNFKQKLFASHKRKSSETRDRIYRLHHALYPNRGFQERAINVSCFIARYSMEFVQFLFDQLDAEETSHRLIYLREMKTK